MTLRARLVAVLCSMVLVTLILSLSKEATVVRAAGFRENQTTSPGRILYLRTQPDGSEDIYIVDPEGNAATNVTNSPDADELTPSWSPDGQKIVFARLVSGDEQYHVYRMNADGSRVKQLTHSAAGEEAPTWSPDGRKISFVSWRHREVGNIFVMRADGTRERRITDVIAPAYDPAWSPNGRWIVFTRQNRSGTNEDLWLVRPDGSGLRPLLRSPENEYEPAWSPDGTKIAFDRPDGIWVMDKDGTSLKRVYTGDGDEPTWSPDGTEIAFYTFIQPMYLDCDVMAVNSDGSEPRAVAAIPHVCEWAPHWGPTPQP